VAEKRRTPVFDFLGGWRRSWWQALYTALVAPATGSTTPTSDGARGTTVEAVRYTRQLSRALAQVFDASQCRPKSTPRAKRTRVFIEQYSYISLGCSVRSVEPVPVTLVAFGTRVVLSGQKPWICRRRAVVEPLSAFRRVFRAAIGDRQAVYWWLSGPSCPLAKSLRLGRGPRIRSSV